VKVSELIAKLKKLPQDLEVGVNDEKNGIFHDSIDYVFHHTPEDNNPDGDVEQVVIGINSED
jgi:hypothetical protein